MGLLMLCVVLLLLYDETSASGQTENFQVAENVTVTLCQEVHLCQNMGCGTSWIRNSACQCDWACEFFDDCCLDFASVCSIGNSDVLDSLTNSQFECISQAVQGTSYPPVARDFWMVGHCPYAAEVSQTNVQIRENCESTSDANPQTLIPVTDASNVTFRNIYCALCHGRSKSELIAWRLNATCHYPITQNTPYEVFLKTVWNECDHFLELPAVEVSGPATRRPCIPSLISTCHQHNPQSLLSSCQSFTAVVKDSDDRSLYRNPACFAACKGSQIYSLECPTETYQMVHDQSFPEIMQTTTTSSAIPYSMPVTQTEIPSTTWFEIPQNIYYTAILGSAHDTHCTDILYITTSSFTWYPVSKYPVDQIDLFDPNQTEIICGDRDVFDIVSQRCILQHCEEGLEFNVSVHRCEPVKCIPSISNPGTTKPDTNHTTFRCLGDSNQGTGVLLMTWTSLETSNLTSNSSNTETEYKNKERCIRDLLDVNLTSIPEADYPYSGNSSQYAFNILVDGILDYGEKVKKNNTVFENSTSRQEAIDSIVAGIENKLEESAKTDASQCGIQSLQIVQYCNGKQRNPYQLTPCSQVDWISLENETQVRVNNQTVWAFDSTHNAWYRLQDYNLRIQYNKRGSLFKKLSLEVGPCSVAPNNSCPAFIDLGKSQFLLVDEDKEDFENGSLIFLQTKEILEPDEFKRTEDGKISICVTKLPQLHHSKKALSILSMVGLVISVAAGTVTLVTYLVFPSLHGRTRKAIMGMVTSLIAAQTLLLLSGIAAKNDKACMAVAVTGHFLWLASLSWTNVLAFLLWNTFATKNPSPSRSKIAVASKVNILSFSYALGVPLAIVTVCLTIHFCSCTDVVAIYDNRTCWIQSGTINLAVFGAPIALFLVINIILFAQTVWAIRSSHRTAAAQFSQRHDTSFLKKRRKELFIYAKIASLMGFTWVFGLSAGFSEEEVLGYLFIILNSLQGLFIFLSFTFNGQVKKLWMEKLITVRGSVLNKTSIVTSRRKSRTTTSSVNAGFTASNATNSNGYTSTSNDSCHEASSEASSRFKMVLRRDNNPTISSIIVKEDVQGSFPSSSD